MSILTRDIRFTLKQLWKHLGFSLTAILSLALGIAATVAAFSVIYSVLLHPFPYAHADRIVRFNVRGKTDNDYTPHIDREHILQLREARSIQDVVEMRESYLADTTVDIPQDTDVVFLSGNAFPFFGVPALLGRTFLPSDNPEGQAPQPVAVLTYQYWQRRFNRNPSVVGQNLRLGGRSYTILGVMPRSFNWWDSDIYVPLDTSDASVKSFMTVLRMKPGYSKAQTTAEIQPIFQQMVHKYPRSALAGATVDVIGLNDRLENILGKSLYMIFGTVLLLLVIGCVNVSILLLARGAARQHEFAVRAAVGASVRRIVQQLLTESLILGFTGSILGVIVTYCITPFIVSILPWEFFQRGLDLSVHIPVLLFSVALAILTSILFGLFPSVQLAKPEIREIIQTNSRKATGTVYGRRLHSILIASQIALAMVLLTLAATAINSFRALLREDLGYDPNHIADFSIPVQPGGYSTWEARANYFRQLRDRVAQTPGVLSASLGVIGPPTSDWDYPMEILGRNAGNSQMSNVNFVDSEFFRSLHIQLLQGRLWDETETNRGARFAVVNKAFVKKYLPNEDVFSHSVRVPGLTPSALTVAGSDGWARIIGVVGDALNDGLDATVKPEIYFPYTAYMINFMQIFVRTHGDPMALEMAVRRQITSVNPGQQVSYPVFTLQGSIERQSEWARAHLIAVLSSIFSIIALLLASVGLYSVVSYSVAQRIQEFAIRMALGAQRHHILENILASVGISVGSGIVVGLILSFGLHRLLARWTLVSEGNPLMVLAVCPVLLIVALLACAVPALRASLNHPMKALRME